MLRSDKAIAVDHLVQMIVLTVFPSLPDPELLWDAERKQNTPFIQRIGGTNEWFCFQNQFSIVVTEDDNHFHFYPDWKDYPDVVEAKEQAIAALHPSHFSYVGGKSMIQGIKDRLKSTCVSG